MISLARPKSQIFTSLPSEINTFLAARSRWTHFGMNIKVKSNHAYHQMNADHAPGFNHFPHVLNTWSTENSLKAWVSGNIHSWRRGTPSPLPPGSWSPEDRHRWDWESRWSPGLACCHLNNMTRWDNHQERKGRWWVSRRLCIFSMFALKECWIPSCMKLLNLLKNCANSS